VRTEAELHAIARVVGAVPTMRWPRMRRMGGPDAVRRAVGFAAGSALPALPAAKAS
jgi:hypothetical protein